MKAVVAAFNQEKALVGAFSVITNLRMELFQAQHSHLHHRHPAGRKGPNTDSPEIWRIDKNISTFNQIQQQLV